MISDHRIGHSSKESHNSCLAAFVKSDLRCKNCDKALTFEQRYSKCCSRRCARLNHNSVLFPIEHRKKCRICSVVIGSKRDRFYCGENCKLKARLLRKNNLTIHNAKSSLSIRKVLLRDFGHECMICHNTEWMSKPIPIEVDHINGHSEDNRPENLRLLCNNCHAQTPTFRSKNNGNGRRHRRAIRPLDKSSAFQAEEPGSKPG